MRLVFTANIFKSGSKRATLCVLLHGVVRHTVTPKQAKNMKRKQSHRPITKTKNPEPNKDTIDWVIWAAWADRVTFEEIQAQTGLSESDVIAVMRRNLKSSSFRLWRKRATSTSIKHRKKFEANRRRLREPSFREMVDDAYTNAL